ncbi:MAG: threonine synthase, partial [Rhodospirillaceae bacterium]|nr:threonine synthase [Rhodospirillaceae bacterium]
MSDTQVPSWTNVLEQRPTFVTNLECGLSGEEVASDRLHGLSSVGRPFLVRYNLPALAKSLDKETLAARPPDMWRYREFLPVRETANIVSLGE